MPAYDILYHKFTGEPITYTALKNKRDADLLVEGRKYRIVNYQCTTATTDTQVGTSYRFDVIVTALNGRTLAEDALVVNHDYGQNVDPLGNRRLGGWRIKYCLDNDTNRFAWAYPLGTGVIYWMRDEFGNEAPYDFINIMFKYPSSSYNYTFGTLEANAIKPAQDNIIGAYIENGIMCLPFVVFNRGTDSVPAALFSNIITSSSHHIYSTSSSCNVIFNSKYINLSGAYYNFIFGCTQYSTLTIATSSALWSNGTQRALLTTTEQQKLAALPTNSSLTTSLNAKVDKVTGKGLSTNDYTTTEKDKLSALPTNANLQSALDDKQDVVISATQHSVSELQWAGYGPAGNPSIDSTDLVQPKTTPDNWSVPIKLYKGQKVLINAISSSITVSICSSATPDINPNGYLTWKATGSGSVEYTIATTGYYTFGTDGTISYYTITDTVSSKFEALDSLVVIDNENV